MSPVLVVGYLLLFFGAAVAVVLGGLLIGRLLRPNNPTPVKGDIYECGEPSLGSADVQFDLRFYVVALVFLIFDVEVAFFFPWAAVFGKATQLSDARLPPAAQVSRLTELGIAASVAPGMSQLPSGDPVEATPTETSTALRDDRPSNPARVRGALRGLTQGVAFEREASVTQADASRSHGDVPAFGRRLARLAMIDIAVFFGILMVGFAYVWYRGDLNWIRTPPRTEGGD